MTDDEANEEDTADDISELSDAEVRQMSEEEYRTAFPSGWMEVARNETLALVIDTLLENTPGREFTPAELAEAAGATTKAVRDNIDSLVTLGIVDELPKRDPTRYSFDDSSPVSQRLYELNRTVEEVKSDEIEPAIRRQLAEDLLESAGEGFGMSDVVVIETDDGLTARITETARRRELTADVLTSQAGDEYGREDVKFEKTDDGERATVIGGEDG